MMAATDLADVLATIEAVTSAPMKPLRNANAILTNGQGINMLARYDDASNLWTIALPCGQIATGVRPSSIVERVLHDGWKVCS